LKLAQEGVTFRQAFSAAPTCSPSRASLLTGHCPHSNGMLGLAHRGFALSNYKEHILHTLRAAGYYSALVGIQHIANDPAVIGYDEVLESPPYRSAFHAGLPAARVASAAGRLIQSKLRQPFFLDVGFFETHREFPPVASNRARNFSRPPVPIPDIPQTRLDFAGYEASVRLLDDGVGEVLRALESAGLADNTLVICTTDHGVAFPNMKCSLTTSGTGVYLIMRGPGGFGGGRVVDQLVGNMDLYPTVCDLAKVKHPEWLQGRSLLPLVLGKADKLHDELFAEVNYHAAYEPKRSVRTQRWNYCVRFDDRSKPVLPNCDDSPSKLWWLENGWQSRSIPKEELYDLVFDPNEINNLAGDSSFAGTLNEMRGRLHRWMKDTADPVMSGRVKAPAGAVVNDPDGVSPNEPVQPA
jgi:arylsulfatase A-like enzyme